MNLKSPWEFFLGGGGGGGGGRGEEGWGGFVTNIIEHGLLHTLWEIMFSANRKLNN